jgi:hypothetical protein
LLHAAKPETLGYTLVFEGATLLFWAADNADTQISQLSFFLSEHHAMKAYWGEEV